MKAPLAAIALILSGNAVGAESCDALLADATAVSTPDTARYQALVTCQTRALAGTLKQGADIQLQCPIAFAIAEKLDLSEIPSSLGPRIDGPTKMAEIADVSVSQSCAVIDFGEQDWERQLELVAFSQTEAVVLLTDRAFDADYNRPGAFLITPDFADGLHVESYCDASQRLRALDNSGCD